MPYSPPTLGWVTLRSRASLESAMSDRDLSAAELADLSHTSKQNVTNIRRGRTKRVREDIAAAIERTLGFARGELFVYLDEPVDKQPVAS